MGFQWPVDGASYVAMYTYSRYVNYPLACYMTTPLLEPLVAGTEYCFSLHLSLADRSAYRTTWLGVVLTEQFPSACNGVDTLIWRNEAQLVFNTSEVDTSAWSLHSGSFVATGGESFVTIGHYAGMLDPDTVFFGATTLPAQMAVYYMDALELAPCAVSVEENYETSLRSVYDPTSRSLSIIGPLNTIWTRVVLLDTAGRVVYSHPGGLGTVQMELGAISEGIYIVRASSDSEQFSTRVVLH